ncbi:MAG: hypothetical protein QXJ09_06975 [Candidatus Caldarchaeum sp.]|uniref:Uncharacterized protein n=1 Tax=Caldiarchaeum subterraneum TaxID=311458 RepID=A0A7C5Q6R9_CALS0
MAKLSPEVISLIIVSLLVGFGAGGLVLGSFISMREVPTVTSFVTEYSTVSFTVTRTPHTTATESIRITETRSIIDTRTVTTISTLTATRTITELQYTAIRSPFNPDTWRGGTSPRTILNSDFEYDHGAAWGVLPCNDWCGYGFWLPELRQDDLTQRLGLVADGTKTVIVMHPISKNTPATVWQPIMISSNNSYVMSFRVRNGAVCPPDATGCGDSILSIRLGNAWRDDVEITRIVLDTRLGWVERSYDITNLIRNSDYFRPEGSLSYIVIEAIAGGPRAIWWGEWIMIDYMRLEVS